MNNEEVNVRYPMLSQAMLCPEHVGRIFGAWTVTLLPLPSNDASSLEPCFWKFLPYALRDKDMATGSNQVPSDLAYQGIPYSHLLSYSVAYPLAHILIWSKEYSQAKSQCLVCFTYLRGLSLGWLINAWVNGKSKNSIYSWPKSGMYLRHGIN